MVSKERTVEFCEKLIQKGLKFVWAAETRANLVIRYEEFLPLMKEAGLVQLDLGVESGSPSMLKEINKEITIEQTRRAFELCKKNGIRTYANILFNIPNETDEDVVLTQRFIDEIEPTVVGCGTTVPLVGTAIYNKYVFPRLTPAEYDLYNLGVYEEIVDERFRLGKYSGDLTKLVRGLNERYNAIRTLTFSGVYWKAVLRSSRRAEYVVGYIRMFMRPLALRFFSFGAKVIPKRIKDVIKNIAG